MTAECDPTTQAAARRQVRVGPIPTGEDATPTHSRRPEEPSMLKRVVALVLAVLQAFGGRLLAAAGGALMARFGSA